MTAECRPPQGTEDGAVCWLVRKPGELIALRWETAWGRGFWFAGYSSESARVLAKHGWRFHSIAAPSEETPDGQ